MPRSVAAISLALAIGLGLVAFVARAHPVFAAASESASASTYAQRGWDAYRQRQYDAAITAFSDAITLAPENGDYYRLRGAARFDRGANRREGENELALADFDKAIELNPDDAFAYLGRARVYMHFRSVDYERALTNLDRAVELRPRDPAMLSRRVDLSRRLGRKDAALADAAQVVRLDLGSPAAYRQLAEVQLKEMADYAAAIDTLTRLIEIDPSNERDFTNRAFAFEALNQHGRAIADLERVLQETPDYGWALGLLARVHLAAGDIDEAVAAADRAIGSRTGTTDWSLGVRGSARLKNGDVTGAIADLESAVAGEAIWPPRYAGPSISLMKSTYDEAVADFDAIVSETPDSASAWHGRGLARMLNGHRESALRDFDRAIELDPDQGSPFMARGRLYLVLHDYDKAIAALDRVIELAPDSPDAFLYRATALSEIGAYEAALEDYRAALATNSRDMTAMAGARATLDKWREATIAKRASEGEPP